MRRGGFRSEIRALVSDGNVMRLFGGRIVTHLGDSLYFVAAMWLIFDLTGSTFYTGLAGALARGPQAFRFLLGPLVDRMNLRHGLVLPQLLQAAIVLTVPLAAAFGQLTVVVVLVVVPLLSAVGQLDDPAQNAAVPRVVDDALLVRANGIFSLLSQGTKAASNAFAGALITAVGAITAYVFNAMTFVVATGLFWTLHLSRRPDSSKTQNTQTYITALQDGVHIVRSSLLLPMIVGATLANFLISIAYAILPAYAASFGGSTTYGLLLGAISAGMLVGALLASLLETRPFGYITVVSFILAAGCWTTGVTFSHRIVTALFLAASGVSVGVYNVFILSVTQTGVPNDFLGRVMALAGSANGIATPSGFLIGGILGDIFPVGAVILAPALGYGAVGVYWFIHPTLRRFGPVTEVTAGQFDLSIESSTNSP